MLHELKHLMGLHHGHDGLMIGDWKARELALVATDALHFNASECREMQSEIAERSRANTESFARLDRAIEPER
jgi:hypothetical protein